MTIWATVKRATVLYRGAPAIHNGADDNASGVVSLIALASVLKQYGPRSNDYLFLAFSGEELGLYGSKSFTENPLNNIDSAHINYMINMDMVGRLTSEEKNLSISGTGTSPMWNAILEGVHVGSIHVNLQSRALGPLTIPHFT
jgi:Zn-dependent M28 family amino/carboxypeptidase